MVENEVLIFWDSNFFLALCFVGWRSDVCISFPIKKQFGADSDSEIDGNP